MTVGPGRNQLCLCGSGKKTKSCCGRGVPGFGATVPLERKERRNEPFVFIAMPTRGTICYETHQALTANIGVPNGFVCAARMPIVDARNSIATDVLHAIEADAAPFTPSEYLVLWIDDDAWFPNGLVPQLVAWLVANPVADLVCGFFGARGERMPPAARRGADIVDPMRNCKPGDVVEIDRCGFHFVLHRASLLKRVGPNPFAIEAAGAEGEDFAFCDRARAAGARLFCATSAKVFHLDALTGLAYAPGELPYRIVNGYPVSVVGTGEKPRSYGPEIDATIEAQIRAEDRAPERDFADSNVREHSARP